MAVAVSLARDSSRDTFAVMLYSSPVRDVLIAYVPGRLDSYRVYRRFISAVYPVDVSSPVIRVSTYIVLLGLPSIY